jgi:hypothetical protein
MLGKNYNYWPKSPNYTTDDINNTDAAAKADLRMVSLSEVTSFRELFLLIISLGEFLCQASAEKCHAANTCKVDAVKVHRQVGFKVQTRAKNQSIKIIKKY